MINKLSVSFIVPCYNENENIVNTVNEILSSMRKDLEKEVIKDEI